MPLIHVRKWWTPLEWIGIELYKDEDHRWYSKRRNRPMKKLSRNSPA